MQVGREAARKSGRDEEGRDWRGALWEPPGTGERRTHPLLHETLVPVCHPALLGEGKRTKSLDELPRLYIEADLAEGRLIAPWPDGESISKTFCLILPEQIGLSGASIQAFAEWILEEAKASQRRFGRARCDRREEWGSESFFLGRDDRLRPFLVQLLKWMVVRMRHKARPGRKTASAPYEGHQWPGPGDAFHLMVSAT